MAIPLSAMMAGQDTPQGQPLGSLMPPAPVDAPEPARPADPIEQAYFARLMADYPSLLKEYGQLPDTNGGRVLNTDLARELSPEYREDRSLSANVHEPSSAFVKQLYADKLAQPTPPGMAPEVVFTAGGTGAGKTTAVNSVKAISDIANDAEMVYDTNMNGFDSARKKIDQALDGGRMVHIFYTYRDPVEALVNGALPRAERMGRTVPLSEHLKTHIGARDAIQQLADHYGDDDRVQVSVIDNSRGPGQAKLSSLDKLPKLDQNKVEGRLKDELEKARARGAISEKVYRGFADYIPGAQTGAGTQATAPGIGAKASGFP